MSSGKEYEMLFKLNAQANSGFKGTFTQAQAEFAKLGNEIQQLNRQQADISAYQKQSAAIESTRVKIENLAKQHALLSQQIEEETGSTAALEREKLKLEQRMASTQSTLENQQGRLNATTQRLNEAGISTDNLADESARLSVEIRRLSEEQEQAAQSAEEYGDTAVNAFEAAGSALAAAGIVTGLKQIGEAYLTTIQAAGDFQYAMSQTEALAGASTSELASLSATAKEMGASTKYTATESAQAFQYMALAGWDTENMLQGISPVLSLAAAAGMDLAQASDIVTDYLTAFGLTASDTANFVDIMAYAMANSNTNIAQLGEAYKKVASTADSMGYSVEETTAAIMTMANAGVKGSEAGTALNAVMTRLATDTKGCASALEEYGVHVYDAEGNMNSLSSILNGMVDVWSELNDQQQASLAKTIAGTSQYSSLQTIMKGCSEQAAKTGQSFNDYAAALQNCSGSAGQMASTMLDNLNGDLTLMQSAWDGLTLTIGEEFMPEIRGLVQAGTGVIGFMDKLIQEHPMLTKVIMGTAGAIGVTTTAIVAYNAARKVMSAFDLASLFAGPVGPILAVAAGIGAVTTGIMAAVDAANEGVPKVSELTQAAREAAEEMEQISADFDSSRVNIAATADVAGMYIDRLDELNAKTSLTSAESTEYHNILQLLCDTMPDLTASIDLETNSINGGTEALRRQTEAWEQNAEEQARQQAFQNLMGEYSEVLVEAKENSLRLTEAQLKLESRERRRAEIMERQNELAQEAGYDANNLAEEYHDLDYELALLNDDIRTSEKQVRAYQEAVDQSSAAAEEAKEATESYADAMNVLANNAKKTTGEVDEAAEAMVAMADVFRAEALSGIVEAGATLAAYTGMLSQQYGEAYAEAYESISGQMGLFEAMSVEVQASVGDMISSLESQVAYMASYSENLRTAAAMGLSDGLIAQLSDGSTESAAYLQEIVTNGQGRIEELNAAFAQVEEGKEEFSSTVAEMQTNLQSTMNQAVRTTQNAVREMDMYSQAAMSARSTMQGFIDGANAMSESVQAAYRNVALGAMAAIQGSMTASLTAKRGYATGTESAAPGFAMVGENGPELVFFQGGEQVLNARETAAMQARPVVNALPASTGGEPVVVQIYFQVEGNATPETIERLREYGEEFEMRVRRVMDEYARDTARRRF